MIRPIINFLEKVDKCPGRWRSKLYNVVHKDLIDKNCELYQEKRNAEAKVDRLLELHSVAGSEGNYWCVYCTDQLRGAADAAIEEAGIYENLTIGERDQWKFVVHGSEESKVSYPCFDVKVMEGFRDIEDGIPAFIERMKEQGVIRETYYKD